MKGNSGKYREGVLAIIIDANDNFLIIQKNLFSEGEWAFIGGGREGSESVYENLFREVREETGLSTDDYDVIGVSSFKNEFDYPKDLVQKLHSGKYIGQSYSQVVVRLKSESVKSKMLFDKTEIKTHQWIKFSGLKEKFVFNGQYDAAQKAINELIN
jgi:putative (di)nucleoside polyphosphate hydrolase